jgi:hypothetical protein
MPDESVKHVCIVARASNTESGIEFIGAVTDITEHIANLKGEIVEANQAFLQMLQYDRQGGFPECQGGS